jgi:hypothetical protein
VLRKYRFLTPTEIKRNQQINSWLRFFVAYMIPLMIPQ